MTGTTDNDELDQLRARAVQVNVAAAAISAAVIVTTWALCATGQIGVLLAATATAVSAGLLIQSAVLLRRMRRTPTQGRSRDSHVPGTT